jgi:hypothetical protein
MIETNTQYLINKGIGAGGKFTNYFGKQFEEQTNNKPRLIEMGYIYNKHLNYLSHSEDERSIIYTCQQGLKKYIKHKYNISLFRNPDEAYIIEYKGNKIIKILEKKEQRVEGSMETKLWSGPSLKREYELVLGNEFKVDYAFCLSKYLQKKITSNITKYTILNKILEENNITILFGDDKSYFEKLDNWIKSHIF